MAPAKAPKSLRESWVAEQERLAKYCVDTDSLDWSVHGQFIEGLRHVAGVDVSFFPDGVHAVAAVVVCSYPQMEVVYEDCATFKLRVPYMPGFLAFREVPALKAMLEKVPSKLRPQAVLVDGNGVFHPRRCGSATHLGIVTGLATIGVAKDVLQVGDVTVETAREVADKLQGASDWAPLAGNDNSSEPLAALLRPASSKKTVVISVGHKVSLRTAVVLTASLCKASIPEPIRQADLRSRKAVRAWFEGTCLRKLKMPREDGAGDLLQMMMPELNVFCNATNVIEADTSKSTKKSKKHDGKVSKAKLAWRVKAVPILSADGLHTNSTEQAVAEEKCESAMIWGKASRKASAAEDSSWSVGVWKFLRQLGGLCVVRT